MSDLSDICSKMLKYMHMHYNEPLTLKQIAAILYMNPAYLGRLFKKETGYQFSDYLAAYRISIAEKLLDNRYMTVAEVAQAVGYNNTNHFFRLFKQLTGTTPSRFRANIQLYVPSANRFILPDEALDANSDRLAAFTLECAASSLGGTGAFLSLYNGLFYAWAQRGQVSASVYCIHSADGGITWSAQRAMLEAGGEGTRVDGVSLLPMLDSSVGLFLTEQRSAGMYLVQHCSYDGMKTWKKLGNDACLSRDSSCECGRVVRLDSKRLVLPISSRRAEGNMSKVISFYVSDDNGSTWRMMHHILTLTFRGATTGLRYPALLPGVGGQVYGYAATDMGCQYEFASLDGAETWTQPQPTALSSPMAPMAVAKFASGQLVALFSPIPDYATRNEEDTPARLVCVTKNASVLGGSWLCPLLLENVMPAAGVSFSSPVLYVLDSTLFAAYIQRCGARALMRVRRVPQLKLALPPAKSSDDGEILSVI